MARIGVTGHRYFVDGTLEVLEGEIATLLAGYANGPHEAVTSLAVGADQLVARQVLADGGTVTFIQPCRRIGDTFLPWEAAEFKRLRAIATVIELDFEEPTNEAFLAAGLEMLRRCDRLIAIWDGLPAVGKGGTGDVVDAARAAGTPVDVVWPVGAARA